MPTLEEFKTKLEAYNIKSSGNEMSISGPQHKNLIISNVNAITSMNALMLFAPDGEGLVTPDDRIKMILPRLSKEIEFPAHMLQDISRMIAHFAIAKTHPEEISTRQPTGHDDKNVLPDALFDTNDIKSGKIPHWIQKNTEFRKLIAYNDGMFVMRFCGLEMVKNKKHIVKNICSHKKPEIWGYEILINKNDRLGWLIMSKSDEFIVSGFCEKKISRHKSFSSATARIMSHVTVLSRGK